MPDKTDQQLAEDIRIAANNLRNSIVAARDAGLNVQIPVMLPQWLETGHAPGEPTAWTIRRKSL